MLLLHVDPHPLWEAAAFKFIGFVVLAFFAVLFLQSGLDKVFDWQGNLDWLKTHFAKSPIRNMVAPVLGILAALEVAGGVISAVSAVTSLFLTNGWWSLLPFVATGICALNFLMLFLGQRMAKDYNGAVGIVSYFILVCFAMVFFASRF